MLAPKVVRAVALKAVPQSLNSVSQAISLLMMWWPHDQALCVTTRFGVIPMSLFAVTAVGADRPGIVAAVAKALESVDGNIEDAAMQALGGQFAISLLVNAGTTKETLEDTLAGAASGLVLTVSEAETHPRAASPTHLFTIYGADRPGLVSSAAAILFEQRANVTNLQSRILPADHPIYVMAFEVNLPDGADGEGICEIIRDTMPGVQASVNTLERPQI